MPDVNGIVPVIFSVASSMTQNCFGYEPMISVPLPADTRGFSPFDCAETRDGSTDCVATTPVSASARIVRMGLIASVSQGKIKSIFRQSFCAAAHFAVQSGA